MTLIDMRDHLDDTHMFDALAEEREKAEANADNWRRKVRSVLDMEIDAVLVPHSILKSEPTTLGIRQAYIRGYSDMLARVKAMLS